jgi:hypothetical protein
LSDRASLAKRRVRAEYDALAPRAARDEYLACRVRDRILRLVDPAHQRIYARSECAALLTQAEFQVSSLERYRISWLWG